MGYNIQLRGRGREVVIALSSASGGLSLIPFAGREIKLVVGPHYRAG